MFDNITLIGEIGLILYLLGVLSALHALRRVRTSQGTIAWCIALLSMPVVALPLYWIFGRTRFFGYREVIRQALKRHAGLALQIRDNLNMYRSHFNQVLPEANDFDKLTPNYFTHNNCVDLLIDGEATFQEIFRAIDGAKSYILIQFYIVRDDELGRELQDRLIRKAREGIEIYFLYDEIGSYTLNRRYVAVLREAGVKIAPFNTRRGWVNRFQLNFRNHRKLVLVDGSRAFVGGLNVGVEYLGQDPHFGRWRDTKVVVTGPAVLFLQWTFTSDWYWAQREFLGNLRWESGMESNGDAHVLPFPTGPTDEAEYCTLFFLNAANTARQRLWIASPYFVPDETIINALALAALRGVDVRIMIAGKLDHFLVYLAAFTYFRQMAELGVSLYRYEQGFLHQKVLLVDDVLASVGTANLDNRSMRLNFEMNVLVQEPGFVKKVEAMLEEDFANSRKIPADELEKRGLHFQLAARISRLFAPIL